MFTSHGVLLLHALDALLSTSLVVVVTAASDGMRFSAIYALLVGLLQLIRVGCVCWSYWRLRRGETAVNADSLKGARLVALEACLPAPAEEAWCVQQTPAQDQVVELPDETAESRKLRQQCEDALRSVTEVRQELAAAGARETRLREALRCRSASLLRLASHLTKANHHGDDIKPPVPCGEAWCKVLDAEVQTVQTLQDADLSQGQAEPSASPAAQLKELAKSSPELRQLVLLRLRSATGAPRVSEPQDQVPQAAVDTRSQDALAQQCAEQAAELQQWQQHCEEQAAQVQDLKQQVAKTTAKLEEQSALLKAKDIEIQQCRKDMEAKTVFNFAADSPELRLRWTEDCQPLPGVPGSAKGARQLKQSLAGRTQGPAELCVGPPPADWRVLLQLRLRAHAEPAGPWEPALLRLSVPEVEVSSYLGLLWPVI